MEQEYLIGVANKFAALVDDEDPYEIIKNVEAEKQKKKALKAAASLENKENKVKDAGDAKSKNAVRKQAPKSTDRVLTADRNVKADNQVERNNKRNRDDRAPNTERNADSSRQGVNRENKQDGGPPRGPRSDGPRGEKRDGPRPFRGDADSRPPRGPRQDGESRPPRDRDRQGFDDVRPARKERREVVDGLEAEGRTDRRPSGPRGRGPRPQGPGRNYDTRGKREFDRKSGSDRTGVKAVDKRDGAGPYNWDSNKDLAALAANDLNVTNQSDEQTDWEDGPAPKEGEIERERKEAGSGEETTDESPAAPEVEEPKELTLDEYRALRGKRELPQFDIRKPGEGEDLTQWKDMVEIKKKTDDEPDPDDELEVQDYPQRVGRQRYVVGIDITFNDPIRGRGRGRGGGPNTGRGRGRDNRRGDDRKDNERGGNRQSAPKVDDERDFPSLG